MCPRSYRWKPGKPGLKLGCLAPQPACLPTALMILFHILDVGPCQDGGGFQENQYKVRYAGLAAELSSATGPSPLPSSSLTVSSPPASRPTLRILAFLSKLRKDSAIPFGREMV